MSTKDNKPDLSNLKSRLGLKKKKKKGGAAPEKGGGATRSGSQSAVSRPKGKSADTAKKSAGGVNDRLAALKKSTLKPKPVEEPAATEQPPATARDSGGFEEVGASAPVAQPAPASQPGGGQPSRQPAGGSAPRGHGPPSGAQGPPPTAMAPPSKRQQERKPVSAEGNVGEAEAASLSDIDLDSGSMFSAPIIVLLIVMTGIGLFFGFMFAQANQTRDLEVAGINDAAAIQTELDERFEQLSQAQEIIAGLDPTDVDFEAAEQLLELDFFVDAGIYPSNRVLLSEEIIRPLNIYIAESNLLTQLLREHHRLTTGLDREELEAFMAQAEVLDEEENVAVVFDLPYFFQNAQDPMEYDPLQGRLVRVPKDVEPDDEGMVEIHVFASNASDKVDIRALVPIVRTDFFDVDTNNALQRYGQRVEALKEYAAEIEKRVETLGRTVPEVADAEPSPLISL